MGEFDGSWLVIGGLLGGLWWFNGDTWWIEWCFNGV
jgi:hypothetical protein